jgi:DNA repair protein RecN (Recombination protein N)
MLRELAVENFAIIDRAEIRLRSGLTALTGETGAGKSLVVDAIELALGGRSSVEMVRAGAAKAVVILTLDLSAQSALAESLGIDLRDGDLVIQREVSASGGSTVRLNGRPASVAALRELGQSLVDLHGQHDHQSLLSEDMQISFLDSWIGEEAARGRSACREAYAVVEDHRRRLARLKASRSEREQRVDMLQFQVAEIREAAVREGETAEWEALLLRLSSVEKLRGACETALSTLDSGDAPLLDGVRSSVSALTQAVRLDEALSEPTSLLETALDSLQEASRSLSRYLDGLESDPEALQSAADRLDLLKRLKRKYGDTESAILDFLAKAEQELEDLTGAQGSEEESSEALLRAEGELRLKADALTALRAHHSAKFQAEVQGHIRDLAMEKAVFTVSLSPCEPGPEGADILSFLFSANPGEPPLPLAKVASGGEISRVMLAIKAAGAGRAGVPTLIFDEVDTGLSGRAAAIMAKKLRELAARRQVICISHLPQIAGQAHHHWRIEKVEEEGRSVTRLTPLGQEERVEELARMLAGEVVSESSLANARDLLAPSA